ncbi:helix-turn-helix domain-containing protein [Haloarcula sp. AONF1]
MVEIYEQEEASVDQSDIQFAIDRGRGGKTEFYTTIPDDKVKLAITACALANNGGGQILLGVDKSGNAIGVDDTTIEENAKETLNQNLRRPLDRKYVTSDVEIDGETIVVILIDEFKKYPLTADGRFYVRHQDEDHLLKPPEVWELMSRNLQTGNSDGK